MGRFSKHFDEDPNEVYPTAKQERIAMRQAGHDARASLETAMVSLDEAKRHFAFLSDDYRYEDCGMALAMVEDIRNSLEES